MQKQAVAILTDQYEEMQSSGTGTGLYTPGGASKTPAPVKMRTIQVQTKRGKPLMVLQSEDTRTAIDETLKDNGWSIVSWSGDYIELAPLAITPSSAPTVTGNVQQTVIVNNGQPKADMSCGGCIAVIVVFFVVCTIVGSIISASHGGY